MSLNFYLTVNIAGGGMATNIKTFPSPIPESSIPRTGERVRIKKYIPTVRDVIHEFNITGKGAVRHNTTVYMDLEESMTVAEAEAYFASNWHYTD